MKPRAVYPRPAGRLLRRGRRALERGYRDEGMAFLNAAVALDPDVFCQPWGLVPLLDAEGRGNFLERMRARRQSWYRPPESRVHASMAVLSFKPAMREWIADLGVPLPRLYAGPVQIDALDWSALPADLVIKPVNRASCEGVVVLKGGIDHVRQTSVGADPAAYVAARYAEEFGSELPPVLVEECLVDVEAHLHPDMAIPRDFKVFTVAGHAGLVRVNDRNAPGGRRYTAHFNRAGRRMPHSLKTWPEGPAGVSLPPNYPDLIAMAEMISQKLPWLLRLDFI